MDKPKYFTSKRIIKRFKTTEDIEELQLNIKELSKYLKFKAAQRERNRIFNTLEQLFLKWAPMERHREMRMFKMVQKAIGVPELEDL